MFDIFHFKNDVIESVYQSDLVIVMYRITLTVEGLLREIVGVRSRYRKLTS